VFGPLKRRHAIPTSEEEAKEALSARLGHAPDAALWAMLVEEGYIDEWMTGAGADYVLRRYRRLERLVREVRARGQPSRRKSGGQDPRLDTLREVLALEAQALPFVGAFRSRHLGGGLAPLQQVPSLIDGWQGEDASGPPLWFPDPSGREDEPPDREWVLEYGDGPPWGERCLPASSPPLRELKGVAERLTARYPWSEAGAVALVLSGVAPNLVLVRVRYCPREVHPLKVEAAPFVRGKELGYALSGFMADTPQLGRRRERRVTPGGAERALFFARHRGLPWRALMALWNEGHPDAPYQDVRRFARDLKQAYEAVRGRWP